MLFSTSPNKGIVHQGEAIEALTSRDGLHWSEPVPILGPRDGATFDNWAVMSPTVVEEGATAVLFYTALGAEPAGSGERWGILLPGGRKIYGTLGRAELVRW